MKIYSCNYCDPMHFKMYGFCPNCQRKCYPPLFDPKGKMTLSEYEELVLQWNEDRSDLINDALRRTER